MILLRKPYNPTIFTGVSATFNAYGKSFYNVEAVYLSGYPYPNTTLFNPFSSVPSLSAKYPPFTAIKLLSSQWSSNNQNTVTFTMPPATRGGYVDIIVQNEAGYGALTRYVIKELYSGTQTQQQLRPWSSGIRVLTGVEIPPIPEGQIYTIDGDIILTISGDNIIEI